MPLTFPGPSVYTYRRSAARRARGGNGMTRLDQIRQFYLDALPGARLEGARLRAPCPFCSRRGRETPGVLGVSLHPDSFFAGHFRCSQACVAGGFAPHFARLREIDPKTAPGFDPDREPFVRDTVFPTRNLDADILKYTALLGPDQVAFFGRFGVSPALLEEMRIGYNGRYLVYPYVLENGHSYAARCVLPGREADCFWHGNETFFERAFRIYNLGEIERCEGGALLVTEGEDSLLALKQIGYPCIAVPSAADLEVLTAERLSGVRDVLLMPAHTPEARLAARVLATRLGHKARILEWGHRSERGLTPCRLAAESAPDFARSVAAMIRSSRAFSPFREPERERRLVRGLLRADKGKGLLGFETGFAKMDRALDGIRGISIMGGLPKAGKSCFFMQISTEMALRGTPVIYYDFENGRRKVYLRTLTRLSGLPERSLRTEDLDAAAGERLERALGRFEGMLGRFRVVTDRQLTPELMRRQVDFLQHETGSDAAVVVLRAPESTPAERKAPPGTSASRWWRTVSRRAVWGWVGERGW